MLALHSGRNVKHMYLKPTKITWAKRGFSATAVVVPFDILRHCVLVDLLILTDFGYTDIWGPEKIAELLDFKITGKRNI